METIKMEDKIYTYLAIKVRENRTRKWSLFFLCGLLFLLFSCHKGDDDSCNGPCGHDGIQLSSKTAEFDASGGVKTITTQGDSWLILDCILSDGEIFCFEDHPEIKVDRKGSVIKKIKGPWYTIIRDSDTSLIIETLPNDTGLSRSLILELRTGNYGDQITIFQSAE